ncbi:hypothetical protein R1sor_003558 [Riccia sorocarpa]|uniref:F-box domain-containing protein n=1 Tax=Riccia sorocarpa TaxID=122646 RepID=A0ABD3H3M0_9MARC
MSITRSAPEDFSDMDLMTSPAKRQSGTASFTAVKEEDELVPSLWEKLPPELCEKVLSKLPLSALRKFSRVSKRWKALFRSVEFARKCASVEWSFFYLNLLNLWGTRNMLLPSLKTNSWDEHSLDFLGADERISEHYVPADTGLLCFRIRKLLASDLWINLVVMNPLTRKWRRLIVPQQLERSCDQEMMWGLMGDRESGSYKVVVAFSGQHLPRKAFIYDSISKSWSNSAALTPVLDSHFDDNGWEVRSVVCSMGELLWAIEEWDKDPLSDGLMYNWLFKYNCKHDTWSMVTQESPFLQEQQVHLVYNDVENRPVMVNFDPPDDVNFPGSERFPYEFLELVPNFGKLGVEDIVRLMNEAGDAERPAHLEFEEVAFGGGTWYFVKDLTAYRQGVEVFALNVNPPTVTRLWKIYDEGLLVYGTFAATLKAFV